MVVDPEPRMQQGQRPALAEWWNPDGPAPWGTDPGAWDAGAVLRTKAILDGVFGPRRYWRVRSSGWEHVPPGPILLVSNHSGGTTILDAIGFGWAWVDHFGSSRPLHGMVHDLLLANSLTGESLARVGGLRASRETGRRAIEVYQRDLVVYPGGDQDTWRPFRDRYRVCFAGRTGYARLALELGVPVVPVAHAGAHESLVVLARGRRLAKALGIHRLARADVFPLHLSLPWGLTFGPWPHLPLPVRFDYRLGAPIHAPVGHRPGHAPSEEAVRTLDEKVQASVQQLLDELRELRRPTLPGWLTRTRS